MEEEEGAARAAASLSRRQLLAGVGIVLALVALNLLSNVAARSLLHGSGVDVPAPFLVYFNVSFDVFAFAIARGLRARRRRGGSRPATPRAAAGEDVANDERLANDAGESIKDEHQCPAEIGETDSAPLLSADLSAELPVAPTRTRQPSLSSSVSSFSIASPTATPTPAASGGELTPRRIRCTALLLFAVYQSGNVLYFWGLSALPLSVSQLVYQSATGFVFLFSLALLKETVTPYKVAALLLCVVGVSLVSLAGSDDGDEDAPQPGNTTTPTTNATSLGSGAGVLCLLGSAALWALYEVLIPLCLPNASVEQINTMVGWRGVWNFSLFWCFPLAQAVSQPALYTWLLEDNLEAGVVAKLFGVASISVALAVLVAVGITMTSPVFMRIGAALNGPASVAWDLVIVGKPADWRSLTGCALTGLAFLCLLRRWDNERCPGWTWQSTGALGRLLKSKC